MDIIYAPGSLEKPTNEINELDRNVIVGYHVQVCETLCEVIASSSRGGGCFISLIPFPHKTPISHKPL